MISTVSPTSGVLPAQNLKSLDNWRAFIHQAVPVIVATLITVNLITTDQGPLWISFAFAIGDNFLSVGNTADRLRKAIYAGIGTLQTGGLLLVLFVNVPEYLPIASMVLAISSAFLARFYTPTTTLVPAMKTGPYFDDVDF